MAGVRWAAKFGSVAVTDESSENMKAATADAETAKYVRLRLVGASMGKTKTDRWQKDTTHEKNNEQRAAAAAAAAWMFVLLFSLGFGLGLDVATQTPQGKIKGLETTSRSRGNGQTSIRSH